MRVKARGRLKVTNSNIFYAVVFIVLSLPLLCDYIISGGIIEEWTWQMELLGNAFISEHLVWIHHIWMLLVQIMTLWFTGLLFGEVFKAEDYRIAKYIGIVLYTTAPFRIYICYDWQNMNQSIFWMLVPLLGYGLLAVLDKGKRINGCVALFLTMLGFIGMCRMQEGSLFSDYIYERGYTLGDFFTAYQFADGYPGMGVGMLVCIVVSGYLFVVKGCRENNSVCKLTLLLGIVTGALSYFCLPLLFWGLSYTCLCLNGASALECLYKKEEKTMATAIVVFVVVACLGLCIYQCNMITYHNLPRIY